MYTYMYLSPCIFIILILHCPDIILSYCVALCRCVHRLHTCTNELDEKCRYWSEVSNKHCHLYLVITHWLCAKDLNLLARQLYLYHYFINKSLQEVGGVKWLDNTNDDNASPELLWSIHQWTWENGRMFSWQKHTEPLAHSISQRGNNPHHVHINTAQFWADNTIQLEATAQHGHFLGQRDIMSVKQCELYTVHGGASRWCMGNLSAHGQFF